MSAFDAIITTKNARPIWKKLSESIVPIIGAKELKEIVASIDQLKSDIKQHKYIPSIGHGYLGYLKSAGCTRFVPILTAEDMTVYYLIVLALQEYLIEDFEGVYGAYRSVPRIVSNFYLNEFDRKFIEYCKSEGILYLRWADDIVLFGKSRIHLEATMHQASRFLLNLGLNFNASKTRHFSKREFKEYRALSLLSAVSKKNIGAFDRELRRFSASYPLKGGRIDTVVKASLNLLSAEPRARTLFSMNYLRERLREYEFLSGFNESQLLKKYLLYGNIGTELKKDIEIILRHPCAAPRATFLSFIRKYKARLLKEGVSVSNLKKFVERIEVESQDSEINLSICVPAAKAAI
ncbi:reverse transcriptase domain-containing protein [Mesorhizobium sp. ORM16]|uniref:reverse transcriptase domain-containing protein n=1 Tax=Mesorhizobium sp. ORM16 TaxID=3376989 RepID=UPI0038575801